MTHSICSYVRSLDLVQSVSRAHYDGVTINTTWKYMLLPPIHHTIPYHTIPYHTIPYQLFVAGLGAVGGDGQPIASEVLMSSIFANLPQITQLHHDLLSQLELTLATWYGPAVAE